MQIGAGSCNSPATGACKSSYGRLYMTFRADGSATHASIIIVWTGSNAKSVREHLEPVHNVRWSPADACLLTLQHSQPGGRHCLVVMQHHASGVDLHACMHAVVDVRKFEWSSRRVFPCKVRGRSGSHLRCRRHARQLWSRGRFLLLFLPFLPAEQAKQSLSRQGLGCRPFSPFLLPFSPLMVASSSPLLTRIRSRDPFARCA